MAEVKLSARLRLINQMVTRHYDHIWDCCCDHGLLGTALLQRRAGNVIHFVDIVEPLMAEVEHKLTQRFPRPDHNWQVHCLDVACLPLAAKEQSQLVIIAGIGGDLMVELVQKIVTAYPEHNLEFLLCPVYHTYKVRVSLQALGLGLVDERLLQDKQQYYEMIHASWHSSEPVSVTGTRMWQLDRPEHQSYLQRTLKHYQRIQQGGRRDVSNIITAYQTLLSA
ncbi:tRNA (adenine(22)-N(1))-methyltransferase [Endozoicomonadaceae bacterium StTr2]